MVGIKETTIHKAIERDSVPSADTALKIAKTLHVSLEYLLDIPKDNNYFLENKKFVLKKVREIVNNIN